jgi:hypothetical protein
MQPDPADPRDEQIARLRKRLRTCQRNLREARAELAARPPAPQDDEPLTPDEIRHLHEQFTPSPPDKPCATCGKAHPGPCSTCGGLHAHACPRVRSVEYVPQGDRVLIKRVTYWRKWDSSGVMFADELPPLPEES